MITERVRPRPCRHKSDLYQHEHCQLWKITCESAQAISIPGGRIMCNGVAYKKWVGQPSVGECPCSSVAFTLWRGPLQDASRGFGAREVLPGPGVRRSSGALADSVK